MIQDNLNIITRGRESVRFSRLDIQLGFGWPCSLEARQRVNRKNMLASCQRSIVAPVEGDFHRFHTPDCTLSFTLSGSNTCGATRRPISLRRGRFLFVGA